ncbi:MAG: ABC transporter ATP-binding protein [SAR202 cluster bacterium]|nr:ABC transporter ATP-binding protein [SAR202 cluster bacterium]|tara:strand:- start:16816 stop:17517 length:702 start_codon:yes stop_codon:yes gene_type:complete
MKEPSANTIPALELINVSKIYQGTPPVQALSNISMSVAAGEFVGIIGASGSGKSTLLHVIGTLTRPTNGSVFINGLETSDLTDQELSGVRSKYVGFIFQDFFLLPGFTAQENVENGLLYTDFPVSQRKERASEILDRVGLSHRVNHLPNEMSGGEQQRVAVARALVHKPAFVLADEPTGNLDSANTTAVLELLLGLNSDGTTVIMITHDHEVADKASRKISFKDGKIDDKLGL